MVNNYVRKYELGICKAKELMQDRQERKRFTMRTVQYVMAGSLVFTYIFMKWLLFP